MDKILYMPQQVTFTELIVLMLLGIWLLLSISYSVFNRLTAKLIYRFNIFNWVSAYQLFTETPKEYHLYYRDQLQNGEMTDWYVITLVPSYQWWQALWYPDKLMPEAVLSAADNFMRRMASLSPGQEIKNISERFNYRVILHYVFRQPVPQGLKARQFKIEVAEKLPVNAGQPKDFISDLHTP